jgi:hypothetical protein
MEPQSLFSFLPCNSSSSNPGVRVSPILSGILVFDQNRLTWAEIIGALLMLWWTVLLIWADRKPIERRGVVLITAV